VSFAVIILCASSQRVFIVVSAYFFIDSVRKLLDTPSCVCVYVCVSIVIDELIMNFALKTYFKNKNIQIK
jgi:hypothetical protein